MLKDHQTLAIITHKNADPDAVASALIMEKVIESLTKIKPYLLLPEGPNLLSKNILSKLSMELELHEQVLEQVDLQKTLLIVVDTSYSKQLGKYSDIVDKVSRIIVIDHHSGGDLDEKAFLAIKSFNVASTSEIAYIISRSLNIALPIKVMQLSLAGILYDSRHLLLAKPVTFKIISELIEKGISYQEVVKLLQIKPTIAERIARIKASLRSRYYRVNDIIIGITYVGAYEASVARSLIELGSDIVFVIGDHDDEIRVIARASSTITDDLGIHVSNDILSKLDQYYKGSGGGHPGAGGYNIPGQVELEELREKLIKLTLKALKSKGVVGQLVEIKD